MSEELTTTQANAPLLEKLMDKDTIVLAQKVFLGTKKNGEPRGVFEVVEKCVPVLREEKSRKKKKKKGNKSTGNTYSFLLASKSEKKKKKKKKKDKYWKI